MGKKRKKNKHRLNHEYIFFFGFNFLMYLNLLSIYPIKMLESVLKTKYFFVS